MGFFDFIKTGLKNLIKGEKPYEEEILKGIDVEKLHDNQDVAMDMIKRIKTLHEANQSFLPEYEALLEEITIFEKVALLPTGVLRELEFMSQQYAEGMLKKENFGKIVNQEHPELVYLEQYKEDIEKVIGDLKRIEDNQRVVKRDLDYLEGEKADLLFKRKRYKGALKALKVALYGLVSTVFIAAIVFSALFYQGVPILTPMWISLGIFMILGLYIFVFRRYMIYELKRTVRLDQRAIVLTNKTKIKYVNNQQYLDYVYQKYKVNSREMLELRFENLQRLKRNKARYQSLSANIATLVREMDAILKQYNIEKTNYVLQRIDYLASEEARMQLIESLLARKEGYQKQMKRNDKEIAFMLSLLKEVDPDITVESIISS